MLGNFSCFWRLLTFFLNQILQKILSGALSECQMVLIQIRMDILSVLIWVQTVCKGYQQMTKIAASKEELIFLTIFHFQSTRLCPAFGLAPLSHLIFSLETFTFCHDYRPPNKSVYLKIIFLIPQPKHML